MTILAIIVEDDITSADIASRQLEAIGFSTLIVGTAEEGFSAVQQHGPQLVVIDERLPDDSGTNLVRMIRQISSDITIAVSTVVDDESMIQHAFAAGCNYYVVKPNGIRKLCTSWRTPDQLLNPNAQELVNGR
jgi:DNA-binding response OmpR family regulator